MESHHLLVIALGLAALGTLLIAAMLIVRLLAVRRSERTLVRALDERATQSAVHAAAARGEERTDGKPVARAVRSRGLKGQFERLAKAGVRWIDTPFGRQIVAEEDRRLLEQCGFVDTRTRGLFLVARVVCGVIVPLLAGVLASGHVPASFYVLLVIMMIVAGFMLPKLYISRRAAKRRNGVVDELPLLVDLLRLLQGVGLSLDQSLQVMVSDFRTVLPVLSSELEIAQRQFAAAVRAISR